MKNEKLNKVNPYVKQNYSLLLLIQINYFVFQFDKRLIGSSIKGKARRIVIPDLQNMSNLKRLLDKKPSEKSNYLSVGLTCFARTMLYTNRETKFRQ